MSKRYRVYKVSDQSGRIVNGKDVEAINDIEAMNKAEADDDCPTCEVWERTRMIGAVE